VCVCTRHPIRDYSHLHLQDTLNFMHIHTRARTHTHTHISHTHTLLQKRPVILKSLLTEATPYETICISICKCPCASPFARFHRALLQKRPALLQKRPVFHRALLQKRPVILRSLLTEATPYETICISICKM